METVIDGVAYVRAAEPCTQSCTGCVCKPTEDALLDDELCYALDGGDECFDCGTIWLKKDDVRQQVEVNKAFGHQMPLFPEIEPTAEEEEFFDKFEEKAKQVGGDHYLKAIQPWDIIRAWDLNYWEGNIVKYTLRHKGKGKIEDLEKAKHYLEYLIKNYNELY